MDLVRLAAIRSEALSVDECLAAVVDRRAGGIAVFVGAVREQDGGRAVATLGYSAHPSAEAVLRTVAETVAAELPVCALAVVHRVGELAIGELAVVVAASAPHRDQAFAAARRLIDDVKDQVPIWKQQEFVDGEQEWVGTA
ncbi:MAG: molybdenum cofactor biosynthesis protein MoaE [Actinomycetota bacterium]|nr:molybdenum cofactor biosynthesis protein MoaE [Actinomycetota bacterium]